MSRPHFVDALRARALYGAAVLTAAALTGACSNITEQAPPFEKYGAVNFRAKSTSPTAASAAATVVFFEAVGLRIPNSTTQQTDQCVYSAVDTIPTVATGDRAAGNTIGITVGGATRQLAFAATERRYATPAGQPITYANGDVAQVSVPGDGASFPAMSGSLKLAEPLQLGPVAVPAAGQSLTVTWNGTNDPTAAIILQLKYANPPATTFANEQVYCALKDDGSATIPGGLLTPFLASGAPRRSVTLIRWRTNLVTASGATLHLTSSIDTTFVFP